MRGIRVCLVTAVMVASALTVAEPAAASGNRSVTCGGLVAYNAISGSLDTSTLMAIPAIGGTPRVVWDAAGQGELDPAWSPDGRSIAFASRTPPVIAPDGFAVFDTRLSVLRSGESQPEVLVEQLGQRGGLRFPTWSPDGKRIAYATGVPPAGETYKFLHWIHVVDVATKDDKFVTGVPDERQPDQPVGALVLPALTWSPRGDRLLASAWEQPGTNNWTIFSVRPDTADPQLTPLISNDPRIGAPTVAPATAFPGFLPSGRAVLVEQDAPDYLSSRLYLGDPQFKHLVPVTAPTGWDTQPDFGPLPLHAAFLHYNPGRTESSIAILTLPTGRSRTIVDPTAGTLFEQPDWQPVLGCRPWPFAT